MIFARYEGHSGEKDRSTPCAPGGSGKVRPAQLRLAQAGSAPTRALTGGFLSGNLPAVLLAVAVFLLAGCRGTPESREADHMKRGLAALAKKDYPRAAIEFKVAAQNMPKDAEPVYQLGMVYLQAGQGQAAFETFRKAQGINPEHEGARYQTDLLDVTSDRTELLEEAQDGLKVYVAKHPSVSQARGALALAEAKLGRKEEAIKDLQETAALQPHDMAPARAMLAFYAAKGDVGAIVAVGRALTERVPDSPEAAGLRAEADIGTGNLPDADAEIARALKLKPDFPLALQLRLKRDVDTGNTQDAYATARAMSGLKERAMWPAYARLLFADQKPQEGMKEFERVLREHPGDTQLRDEYSGMLLRAGMSKEAGAAVSETLAKDAKDRPALLQRIQLETDAGDLDGASRDVKTLHEMKAFSPQLSYEEAHIFAARGDVTREGDLLAEVLKMNPNFLQARLELAELLVGAGNPKKALELLEQASEVNRSAVAYFRVHGQALIAAGEYAAARKDVDIGLANGRAVPFLIQDAILKEQGKDLAGARKSLEEGFAKQPGNPQVLALLGGIMRQQGQLPKFLAMVKDAAAAHPDLPGVQLAYGRILRAQGQNPAAIAAFEAAKKAGAAEEAEFEIAQIEAVTAPDQARQRLLELARSHDSARVEIALAGLEIRTGAAPDEIIQRYLRAAQLEPTNALALNNLADMLATRSKLDDAFFWGQKAIALAPGSADVQDTMGWIYYLQKKYDAALPLLMKSLKGRDRAVAHYHLAAALLANRDAAGARREYEAGVKQDPKSPARAEVSALFEK